VTDRTAQDLQRSILEAQGSGDETRVRELQEQYRRTMPLTRITRATGSIQLIERSPDAAESIAPAPPPLAARRETVPLAVRLTSRAREQLKEIDFNGSIEHGAFLFGFEDDHEVVVCQVGRARHDGTEGDSHSVDFDSDFAIMREKIFDECGLDWRTVGTVHNHPDLPDDELRLSTTDESQAARWAVNLHETVVSLLLGPDYRNDYDPWAHPRMKVWITPRDGSCRAAPLIIEQEAY
jgi:hypothetical protein